MTEEKGSNRRIYLFIGVALVCMFTVFMVLRPGTYSGAYRFIRVDHPVEMWQTGPDRWAYFSPGQPGIKMLAQEARAELVPLGFKEDNSKAPWVRFLRGSEEVVICNHDEFALDAGKLVKTAPMTLASTTPRSEWSCVLVKNAPFTRGSLQIFNINKLVHGW